MIFRGRGYRPDPKGHRMLPFSLHPAGSIELGDLPSSVDLRPRAPRIMDQGATSSCTGHAVSVAIAIAGIGLVPSPADIYRLGRCMQRADEGATRVVRLTDDGAAPNEVVRGVQLYGVRELKALAPDGRNSDADPATINDEPTLDELEADATHLIVEPYAVKTLEDVMRALAVGKAVCRALRADATVQDWNPSAGPITAPEPGPPDHYATIVGYHTLPNGTVEIDLQNSWGTGWGVGGFGICGPGWYADLSEANMYAFDIAEDFT